MKRCSLDGTPIVYYVSKTEGKPWALFLHAAFVDHHMFQGQLAYFQERYSILLPDLIGHGDSVHGQKGDGLDKMSDWLYGILKQENVGKAHIVGISLGAVLAQDFADRHPEAVESLACFGGYDIHNFDPGLQKQNGMAQMGMMLKAMVSIRWFAKANRKISAYTQRAQQEFYEMNLRFPKSSFRYFATLHTLINAREKPPRNYPLLIGCGEHDIPAEITAVKMWKEREPEFAMVIFPGAGHCVNMDVPRQFHQTLEEFWARETGAGKNGSEK